MDVADAAARFVEHGYCFLPGYLTPEETAASRASLHPMFPTAEEFHDGADPGRAARFGGDQFGGIEPFPFAATDAALLATHPKVVALAAAILETDDVRLYGLEAWAKYTGAADYEQDHHRDYDGHSLLVPSDAPAYRQAEVFVYLSDVTEGCAPTRHVPRALTDHLPVLPRSWSRAEQPALYDAETYCTGPAGTVVAWSTGTFHRAVALTEPRGARYTLHANYRAAASEWAVRTGWGYAAVRPEWRAFVARASVDQLALFGFPRPGHPFWTPETLAATAVRYPGLDLSPWS